MHFKVEKVKEIAHMARIHIDDTEMEKMGDELEGAFKWIKAFDDVDAGKALPMSSVSDHPLPRRQDTVKAECTREELVSGAPDMDKDSVYFAVPKIIE